MHALTLKIVLKGQGRNACLPYLTERKEAEKLWVTSVVSRPSQWLNQASAVR